jgi:hypothetical protein
VGRAFKVQAAWNAARADASMGRYRESIHDFLMTGGHSGRQRHQFNGGLLDSRFSVRPSSVSGLNCVVPDGTPK